MKKKGKVYPSQSSSSSASNKDPHSVLKLLPVTILALASSLPVHDQEVLAYMITRSILVTTKNPSFSHKNKCKKKPTTTTTTTTTSTNVQKNHLFECGCFDCYTSFWYRWDSSPNRELIHQAIEVFEEHLLLNESPTKQNRGKKRDKVMGRFESDISEKEAGKTKISVAESEVMAVIECQEEVIECEEEEKLTGNLEMAVLTGQGPWSSNHHKGLARKVLPDVMGILNSRLWSLWSPGI